MSTHEIPRLAAQTRRFTLGRPRTFTVSSDGSRVVFVRARSGTDPVHQLWVVDADTGIERLVVDPRDLRGSDHEDLPPEERARRERLGEAGNGITAYTTDEALTRAVFALAGEPWIVDLFGAANGDRIATPGPVIDPRIDPTGQRVAYVHDGGLWVTDIGGAPRNLLSPESETVTYGLADFASAEELERIRGFWWAPNGTVLLAQRTDEAPVQTWWLSEPVDPSQQPTPQRYPVAGSDNAKVSAVIVHLNGATLPVSWDTTAYPYLARAWWDTHGPVVVVMSRDQRSLQIRSVNPSTGATTLLAEQSDDAWVELVPGLPSRTPDGRLVTHIDDPETDTRLLAISGQALAAPGLQLRSVEAVSDKGALVVVSADPIDAQLVRLAWDGTLTPVLPLEGPGVQYGTGSDDGTIVVQSFELARTGCRAEIVTASGHTVQLADKSLAYPVEPHVEFLALGSRQLRTAVVLPTWWTPGSAALPVIFAPYGGPHMARVVAARGAFIKDQWLADQGFAVVVVDGRGTPGRGPAWEKAVFHDLTQGVLADQIEALDALLAHYGEALDGSRVGIHGWSFGGYLAALAVLAAPDRFHAAVAGAPVTDFRLYDTAYTERYLGLPQDEPEVYEAASLLPLAANLRAPLLIVHGLSDDNVYSAHSLALSRALLEAGRPHSFLPLSGESHRAPAVVVAENEDKLIAAFFQANLGVTPR